MKSKRALFVIVCVLALAAVDLGAQDQESPPWLWVGPRMGVTSVVTSQWRFDRQMQAINSRDVMYYPVYSQVGLNLDQRVQFCAGSSLLFRETVLLGGLDQNVLLPSFAALAGIGWDFGLEVLIGPEVSRDASDGDPEPVWSFAVAVGWVFQVCGRPMPVSLVVVPLSADWEPRITALVGFDFPVRFPIEKKKLPFNY
jgi:hypothetical protein